MRRTHCFILVALFCIIGVFILPAFSLKSFCLLFLIAMFSLSLAIAIKNIVLKYVFITILSLCLPIALIDGYFTLTHVEQTNKGERLLFDDEKLGYSLPKDKVVTSTLTFDDEIVYDVTYSIDKDGHRITPHNPNAKIAVLLFGGSFTFGQGIGDTESFAYKLGMALGENYQVINYGVPGYGPHQMLAEIELGLPIFGKFDYILTYYTYINTHEIRAAGGKRWGSASPRYLLENGKAVRSGTFQDNPPFFWQEGIWTKIPDSNLYDSMKKALIPYQLIYDTNEKRMQLTTAIVEKSAEEIRQHTKKSKFTVLAWPPQAFEKFSPNWQPNPAIPVIDLHDWLPNSRDDIEQYRLKDLHPNALAADFVAKELTKLVEADAASLMQ